jgi:hypothetical protein
MRKLLSIFLISLFLLSEAVNISFAYTIERPPRSIDSIGQREENATVNDEAAVGIGVDIHEYRENPAAPPYGGKDGVMFRVIATANTRKGIEYDYSTVPISPYWVEATKPTNITDDDSGVWIDIPFGVIFYGGPGVQNTSAIYTKVWVCDNGFLSFDCDSTSPIPTYIPSPTLPNSLIAAYWSDIDPAGGSITYYADLNKFVVEWKNVKSKYNGQLQTFEVVILNDYYPNFRGQNRIFLLYQAVTWQGQSSSSETSPLSPPPDPTIQVVQGIEDQEGYKGTEPPIVDSGYGIQLTAKPFSSPEIRELNILMNKTDSYARVYADRNPWAIRGGNVQYKTPEPDPNDPPLLGRAVTGGLTLLMSSAIGLAYGAAAGLMFGVTRVTTELGYDLARQLWEADPIGIRDEYSDPGTNFCYVNASAVAYYPPYDYPVDASIGTEIFWVFLDDNNLDHELTLTAQVKYYSHIQQKIVTLNTSTTLRVYIGTPLKPAKPSGTASGYIGVSYSYTTSTMTPDGDSIYYQFDWKDGSTTTIGPYSSDTMVSASHTWGSTGTYDVQVRAKDSSYEVWSAWSSSLTVIIYYGGGCPTLFVWNGSDYVDYGVINIHDVENDVVREVHVQAEDVSVSGHKVKFTLREGWEGLNYSHSLIDQVKLYAVDSEGNRYLCPLIKAEHSEQGKVLLKLLFSDDYRIDTCLMDTIDLTFIVPYPTEMIENFTFIIEGHNPLKR